LFLAPLALHTVGGWALAAVLAAAPVLCLGQAADSIDELAAKATDPTAQLMSLQLSDWYTASFHGLDDTSNQLVFRAALPFDLGATKHIFRVTQPYSMSSPAGGGLIDITVFDLVVFDRPWGRWGAGVSGTMPTGSSGLTTDKWTAGPALGFVNSSTRPVNWGLFMQSFFSFAGKSGAPDVGIINLQPIFSCDRVGPIDPLEHGVGGSRGRGGLAAHGRVGGVLPTSVARSGPAGMRPEGWRGKRAPK
jgi:hypothetical protein